jgi:hypothetical protein
MGPSEPAGERRGNNQLIEVVTVHSNGWQDGSCIHGILHGNELTTGRQPGRSASLSLLRGSPDRLTMSRSGAQLPKIRRSARAIGDGCRVEFMIS